MNDKHAKSLRRLARKLYPDTRKRVYGQQIRKRYVTKTDQLDVLGRPIERVRDVVQIHNSPKTYRGTYRNLKRTLIGLG